MKKFLYSIIILSAFASSIAIADCGNSCCDDDCCDSCLSPCQGSPLLLPRSQGRNSARELSQWEQFINLQNKKDYSGAFYSALEYAQSSRPCQISQFLFGSDIKTDCCSNTLLVQGSQVENRNSKAWLADYFGLSPLFESSVSFCPKIQNVILDLNWVLNLDKWAKGLYVKLDMPLTWSQWDLGMCEVVKDNGSFPATGFDAGYMAAADVNRNVLPDTFTQAMSGTTTFGDMTEPIKFGKMTSCKLSKVGIADLRGTLGYNFILKEDGHFGIYGILAAPTGNRPNAWYLFEPIVGNGKHWELGAGLSCSWIFHRCTSKSDDKYLGLYLDATISHLFKSKQCRSFDFDCKPGSRYMLLEKMGANTDNIKANIDSEATPTTYQYKSNLIPAINWSTFCVDVSIAAQADIAIKLTHVKENWNFDIGYNFWARTGEKFCCDCDCDCNSCGSSCTCSTDDKYALKGDAYLYGQYSTLTPIALSATESAATIHSGTNYPVATGDYACTNTKVDNAYFALDSNGLNLHCVDGNQNVKTSQPSVLACKDLLNMCKTPSSITHKLFLSINHAWKDASERYLPFLGAGAEFEWAQGFNSCCGDSNCGCNSCTTNCTTNNCNSCNSCNDCCCPTKRGGVSQWGLWLKGGVQFD
ncbi:MAG: hypothetical protein UR12_C0011G0006 [candidate division TM6 bacterium GW2011_GWF2_30_66]|jgi:hypothetical protein|nr:MAG: hypothetical protein UR12_C0011G0006 [candidate division TM6 bacterium GW2011_GWF2_30_66]